MFQKHIEPLYLNYLKDRASGIRDAGIKAIPQLCKTFGDTWVNSMLSRYEDVISKEGSYHFKIAAIYSLKEISLSNLGDKYVEKCLTQIFKVISDPVPNVREVCIKALRDIAHKYDKGSIRDAIKKEIHTMSSDTDHEVKLTATEVLSKIWSNSNVNSIKIISVIKINKLLV